MSLAEQMKQLSEDSLVKRADELKGTQEYEFYTSQIKRTAVSGLTQKTFQVHTPSKRIALMEALRVDGFTIKQGTNPVNITVHW